MSLKVVPFKSLDAVYYSRSLVIMAVSVAVCDIFSLFCPQTKLWLCEVQSAIL